MPCEEAASVKGTRLHSGRFRIEMVANMKIVIVATDGLFEVRVINDQDLTTRKFTYQNVEQARRAATAWSVAFRDCAVIDETVGVAGEGGA